MFRKLGKKRERWEQITIRFLFFSLDLKKRRRKNWEEKRLEKRSKKRKKKGGGRIGPMTGE